MLRAKVKTAGRYVLSSFFPVMGTKLLYRHAFHRSLNLKKPETLNEKILWLKHHTYKNDPLVSRCADKYAVRSYVEEMGCGEILNELYAAWDAPEEIDWDSLPEAFVLKCNHGTGYNLICRDKGGLDVRRCEQQLREWLQHDYWRDYIEFQYRPVPKKIICERMLGDGNSLTDYKIYCFHGKPTHVLVCVGREKGRPTFYFFDREWKFCPITGDGKKQSEDFTLPKPENLERMFAYAERLSAPFPFVRADFYDVDGKVYFGELTFTPSAGLDNKRLPETDRMFGEMLQLP